MISALLYISQLLFYDEAVQLLNSLVFDFGHKLTATKYFLRNKVPENSLSYKKIIPFLFGREKNKRKNKSLKTPKPPNLEKKYHMRRAIILIKLPCKILYGYSIQVLLYCVHNLYKNVININKIIVHCTNYITKIISKRVFLNESVLMIVIFFRIKSILSNL